MRRCPKCSAWTWKRKVRCPSCEYRYAFNQRNDTNDREWIHIIEYVTEQGKYRYSLNQLFMVWQKKRARKVQGAQLRAILSGLGLWLALFPPNSPSPLTKLVPQLQMHLPARGLMWSLFVSLIIVLIPWSLVARPMPTSLPKFLGTRPIPAWLSPVLWRLLRIISWEVPLILLLIATLWMILQYILGLTTWPFPWVAPSLALLPPILLGFGARFDTNYLKTRASKARFVEQFQVWHKIHPLLHLLDKPRMQIPQSEYQGGLYDEEVRKILIVDQDLTVDLLAKNGIHKLDSLLILSLQKYPEPAAKFARRLLALYPDEIEIYVLHNEQRTQTQVQQQLKAIGVTPKHRTLQIGWGVQDLRHVIAHLGFRPVDWEVFAIDTLSPKSLIDSVISAIAVRLPIAKRLVGNAVLPPPPPPKQTHLTTAQVKSTQTRPSDPQLDAFLTPEPHFEPQGTALQATQGDET